MKKGKATKAAMPMKMKMPMPKTMKMKGMMMSEKEMGKMMGKKGKK